MSKRHLSRNPQKIDPDTWFYEEGKGLFVVRRANLDGRTITENFIIPWRMVRASLKRKDQPA